MKTEFTGIYILTKWGIECDIKTMYSVNLPSWISYSKNSLYQLPSVDNYCIYTIQYSLFDYCWMIAAEHSLLRITIFIVRRARGSKEYRTNPKDIACSKFTIEILEQGVKYVQS